ncbi:MAG: hypothetical protein P1V81_12080 [Planctomycetota bacterium]|nr:hypothetical protein [Planctomycetota bacterium]
MASHKLWVLILALVSALAGFTGGQLVQPPEPPQPERALFAGYADRLAADFDLSPDRERALRLLLMGYERKLEELKTRHLAELEPELVRLGDTYRDYIRDKVLPEDRRAEFDALVSGNLSPRAH